MDARESLTDVIVKCKAKIAPGTERALADAIVDGLGRKGIYLVGEGVDGAAESGSHLVLLKSMRRRIAEAVADPDCPARDLASLTRRLQDVSREITSIEEKLSAEQRASGSGNSNGTGRPGTNTSGDSAFDPTTV